MSLRDTSFERLRPQILVTLGWKVRAPADRQRARCFDAARSCPYARQMKSAAAAALVFVGGFIIMVLEIIGARFLARDFGGYFYVWVSQIGVVLVALALGYFLGGALADRWHRLSFLAALLAPAGVLLLILPETASWLIGRIISRHPAEQEVPALWQQ